MVVKLDELWVEVLTILCAIVGFVTAILLESSFLSFASVFLGGFISARLYYFKRYKEPVFPFILIIAGFLVGYLIGNIWTSRIGVLIFFALGFASSYYLHMKKILVNFKSEEYIK